MGQKCGNITPIDRPATRARKEPPMAQRSESLPDPLQSPESNPELVAKGEQQAQAAVKAAGLTPDEVETVAVEAPSGPVEMPKADTPLVVAEYTTDEALLKDYADLLTGQRQRTFAFAMCVVDLVLAVMVVVTWPSLWIVAVVLVALAVAMMIWRRHASANVAKRLLKGLDKADLHRVVSVYGDHVVLTKSDGTPHRYDRKDLSELKHNDTIGVLAAHSARRTGKSSWPGAAMRARRPRPTKRPNGAGPSSTWRRSPARSKIIRRTCGDGATQRKTRHRAKNDIRVHVLRVCPTATRASAPTPGPPRAPKGGRSPSRIARRPAKPSAITSPRRPWSKIPV